MFYPLCLLCCTHKTSDKYLTMHHFVIEMCKHVHISVTTCCIVGYGAGALWDLCNRLISCFFFYWAIYNKTFLYRDRPTWNFACLLGTLTGSLCACSNIHQSITVTGVLHTLMIPMQTVGLSLMVWTSQCDKYKSVQWLTIWQSCQSNSYISMARDKSLVSLMLHDADDVT